MAVPSFSFACTQAKYQNIANCDTMLKILSVKYYIRHSGPRVMGKLTTGKPTSVE